MITIEWLRQFRIAGYALFDILVSLFGIYLLSPLLSKLFLFFRIKVPKNNWVFLTLPLGILIHILVGTITPMTKSFLDMNSNYVLKVIVIVLTIIGIRGIKILKKSSHK